MDKPAYRQAQKEAMRIVDNWVRTNKTPVPKHEIFKGLVLADISESTARKSIAALVKQGYIRRTVDSITSRGTSYVMIKNFGSSF